MFNQVYYAQLHKFVRPEVPRGGVITDRDLDIIEAVLRYRFSPTSELSRLVGGPTYAVCASFGNGLHQPLRLPRHSKHSEFICYLDSTKAFDLLSEHGRLPEIDPQMAEDVRLNREADYAGAVLRDSR